jgi:hypothetical protein
MESSLIGEGREEGGTPPRREEGRTSPRREESATQPGDVPGQGGLTIDGVDRYEFLFHFRKRVINLPDRPVLPPNNQLASVRRDIPCCLMVETVCRHRGPSSGVDQLAESRHVVGFPEGGDEVPGTPGPSARGGREQQMRWQCCRNDQSGVLGRADRGPGPGLLCSKCVSKNAELEDNFPAWHLHTTFVPNRSRRDCKRGRGKKREPGRTVIAQPRNRKVPRATCPRDDSRPVESHNNPPLYLGDVTPPQVLKPKNVKPLMPKMPVPYLNGRPPLVEPTEHAIRVRGSVPTQGAT